jgi:hypothetical protein
VKIIITDIKDRRLVEDILFCPKDYQNLFTSAGFEIENIYKPLGEVSKQKGWITETKIAPWNIYVLKKTEFQNNPKILLEFFGLRD